MPSPLRPIGVMCVDDNPEIGRALRIKFGRTPGYAWLGSRETTEGLPTLVAAVQPDVLLLDLDMPGEGPFATAARVVRECPDARILFFSGHVRADLIEQAIEAGAWGYVSKGDGEEALFEGIQRVAAGEFYLSAEARTACDRD